MSEKNVIGTIGWLDLTVDDAPPIRQFYEDVVGWSSAGVDMGEYQDFSMIASDGETAVAGVCHAKGPNAEIPPYWIVYLMIENLDRSLDAVRAGGGTVVAGPRSAGSSGRYCIIRDPAGAYIGLFEASQPAADQ